MVCACKPLACVDVSQKTAKKKARFTEAGLVHASIHQMERDLGMGGCLMKYWRMPSIMASASLA